MLHKFSLMASYGFPSGLGLQQEFARKGCQQLVPKPEIIKCPNLRLNSSEELRMTSKEWFDSNQFVNFDLSALKPMVVDVQATCPSRILFSSGVVDQCTEHQNTLQCITSETAEAGIGGVRKALLSDLMGLQLSGIDIPQLPLPPLVYPNKTFYFSKPLLDIFQDSALRSKITVHPDGQVTFMGTEIEMKDLLAVVAESYLTERTHNGEKQSMLVPHFSRLIINEVEARSHSSTLDIHSTLAVPLKRPEKVKSKPSQKKNKKVARERDLFKKNYVHACESLLFLMADKRHHRETAILSLKKSGPELSELLTQFSVGIAGTGLAVVLSVICKLACGRVPFCASKVFNTGLGFGLVWLSCGVNKLRDTIININKNAGKTGLKDKEMIQKVDKSLKEVYFRAAALLVVAVLRLA
ncbi:hypothetical protein TSUD_39440 [Trifolium subterraneum]|uniref:Uncharacterized protein n=1 Tax=Trifolium subterraneum TaxID=3900 RepID=A0A2Z6N3R5_TRISU|nr:hypothetical protein TSUD_39440 [Trifolium subterraneum]